MKIGLQLGCLCFWWATTPALLLIRKSTATAFVPPSLGRHSVPARPTAATSSLSSSLRGSDNNSGNSNHLGKLSVTELKRRLSDLGVDFRDCLEKRDLVQRLEEALTGPAAKARQYQGRGGESVSGRFDDATTDASLHAYERGIISTFKRVSPSVAYIQTTSVVQARRGFEMRGMEVPAGTGSGFLWDSQGSFFLCFFFVIVVCFCFPPHVCFGWWSDVLLFVFFHWCKVTW